MSTHKSAHTIPPKFPTGSVDYIFLDGESIELDEHTAHELRKMRDALRRGETVQVSVLGEVLTTQEAADFLGISRPSLVKLLDDGVIPSTRPGSHRRVLKKDLQEFIDDAPRRRAEGLRMFRQTHTPADDELKGFVSTR